MTTGDQEPTSRFLSSIKRQAEVSALIAQKERERQQAAATEERPYVTTQAERERILADTRGISVDELLGKESAQICTEFLDLMKLKDFPGTQQITSAPKKVAISQNGLLSWLRPNQGSKKVWVDQGSALIAKGYHIGVIWEPHLARSGMSYDIFGSKKLADSGRAIEYQAKHMHRGMQEMEPIYNLIDEIRPDFYISTYAENIYLCTDGRVRNRYGGSIPVDYRAVIGVRVPVFNQGSRDSRGTTWEHIAELPIEDVLANHVLKNSTT